MSHGLIFIGYLILNITRDLLIALKGDLWARKKAHFTDFLLYALVLNIVTGYIK